MGALLLGGVIVTGRHQLDDNSADAVKGLVDDRINAVDEGRGVLVLADDVHDRGEGENQNARARGANQNRNRPDLVVWRHEEFEPDCGADVKQRRKDVAEL